MDKAPSSFNPLQFLPNSETKVFEAGIKLPLHIRSVVNFDGRGKNGEKTTFTKQAATLVDLFVG